MDTNDYGSVLKPQRLESRLESLDLLRGFDLFCLVGLEGVMHALSGAVGHPWMGGLMSVFTHKEWVGLSPWDLVMPLFMFMAGVAIPFSMARYKVAGGGGAMWRRLLKRVVVLWLFGMMCQGNLLGLDPDRIYLYTNTLQAIAAGYLIAALIYVYSRTTTQVAWTVGLMAVYWVGMAWGGDYTAEGNFAEMVDRMCLGRFRDGACLGPSGEILFAPGYTYTWIWSTLTFGATVMFGVLTGAVLRLQSLDPRRRAALLALGGAVMIGLGMVLSPWQPVVKRIWTATFTLLSGGWCVLLMAATYYLVDIRGVHRGLQWLKVYGMNSIAAYMIMSCVDFSSLSRSVFYGLEQYVGAGYPAVIAVSNAVLTYLVLLLLYRRGCFLRV